MRLAVFAGGQTGERVDDAQYSRDREIEQMYNVTFNYVLEPGAWAERATFNGLIQQSVMAADGAFDLVDGMIAVTLPIPAEGVFLNLLEMDVG